MHYNQVLHSSYTTKYFAQRWDAYKPFGDAWEVYVASQERNIRRKQTPQHCDLNLQIPKV